MTIWYLTMNYLPFGQWSVAWKDTGVLEFFQCRNSAVINTSKKTQP